MPLFVLFGKDGSRGVELRKEHRDAHIANIRPLVEAGRIRYAGPLVDVSGGPCGSVIVFEAESLDAARDFAANDPYVTRGIFATHEVVETRQVFPED